MPSEENDDEVQRFLSSEFQHAKQRPNSGGHRTLSGTNRIPRRTRQVVRTDQLFPHDDRETVASHVADAHLRNLLRPAPGGHAGSGSRRGLPQLHVAARRHHGQRGDAPGQPFRLRQMGTERRHPVGRRDAHQRLPPVERIPASGAAADSRPLQYDGHRSLRRTTIRYGFRSPGVGFRSRSIST